MQTRVKRYLQEQCQMRPGAHVLAACSGGTDSLALLHILAALVKDKVVGQLTAIYVHHHLRTEADQEAIFVEKEAKRLGAGFILEQAHVPAFRQKHPALSPEEAARILRYQALRRQATVIGADCIALAHHRDDQAETLLLHLLRGAGMEGLRGMQARNDDLIRPLLAVTKAELRVYCRQQNLQPREDISNQDCTYLRNKIRMELIPLLAEQFNPMIGNTLAQTAQLLADDHKYLQTQTEEAARRLQITAQELPKKNFPDLPVALQRRLIRYWIQKKWGNCRGIRFIHVETLREALLTGQTGSQYQLPAKRLLEKTYTGLVWCQPVAVPQQVPEPVLLSVPGAVCWGNWRISAEWMEQSVCAEQAVCLSAAALQMPLQVRSRRPGDRLRPEGLGGSQKVKDLMINHKIPRLERPNVPILEDKQGIVAVGSLVRDERCIPGHSTGRVVILRFYQEVHHAQGC